jgi:hypothetical protein
MSPTYFLNPGPGSREPTVFDVEFWVVKETGLRSVWRGLGRHNQPAVGLAHLGAVLGAFGAPFPAVLATLPTVN